MPLGDGEKLFNKTLSEKGTLLKNVCVARLKEKARLTKVKEKYFRTFKRGELA